jgi:hypothetical protein
VKIKIILGRFRAGLEYVVNNKGEQIMGRIQDERIDQEILDEQGKIEVTLSLDEEDRKAIRFVREPDDRKTYELADAQECQEHLEGFVELAIDEMEK